MIKKFTEEDILKLNDSVFKDCKYGLMLLMRTETNHTKIALKINDRENLRDKNALTILFLQRVIRVSIYIKALEALLRGQLNLPITYGDNNEGYGYFSTTKWSDLEKIIKVTQEYISLNQKPEDGARINIRYSQEQLSQIREAAALLKIPYTTYIKEASLRKSLEDIKKYSNHK